jgi:hypothetical protein
VAVKEGIMRSTNHELTAAQLRLPGAQTQATTGQLECHPQPFAGSRQHRADGQFPEGSVNAQVERRLQEFAQCLKEFATTSATEPHGATAGSDQRARH